MTRTDDANGPPRRGQLASEMARFEMRGDEAVSGEALGALPAGYGLTFVRAWVRDPHHVVAAWDVNAREAVRFAETGGWDRLGLRATDTRNRVLLQVLVGRRAGTHHLAVPSGRTVRLAVGLERPDGRFFVLARSGPVRVPPDRPGEDGTAETLHVPVRLDRRLLVRADDPARPGHRAPGRISPGWRLWQRLVVVARSVPPDRLPPDLQPAGSTAIPPGLQPLGAPFYDEDRSPVIFAPSAPAPDPVRSARHWRDHWISGLPPRAAVRRPPRKHAP